MKRLGYAQKLISMVLLVAGSSNFLGAGAKAEPPLQKILKIGEPFAPVPGSSIVQFRSQSVGASGHVVVHLSLGGVPPEEDTLWGVVSPRGST